MAHGELQIDISDLLATRKIRHPSSFSETKFVSERQLEITVEGYPWWLEGAAFTERQTIKFVFSDITHGVFYFEDLDTAYDEALEDFSIAQSSKIGWAQADAVAIHCSSPLADSLGLFAMVQDYLCEEQSLFDAKYFLNFVSSRKLSKFKRITETQSYLLARAPKVLSDLICGELDRQGVKFRNSPTGLSTVGDYHVRIGETQFFCNRAVAHIEN